MLSQGITRSVALLALLTFACDRDKEPDKNVPGTPDVHLRRFEGCDDLRAYVVDVTLETLVSYRYAWGWYGWPEEDAGGGEGGEDSPDDYTTTNVQEEGVDEPDMVKTDGEYIYVVQDQSLFVVDTWPAAESSLASELSLEGYPYSMFLYEDSLVVFSYLYDEMPWDGYYGGTRIDLVDVSDRAAPEIVRSIDVEGWFADARMVDGQVYAVLNSWTDVPQEAWSLAWDESLGLPELTGEETEEELQAKADVAREILRPYVDEIVAGMDLSDLVPEWRDQVVGAADAAAEPMYACTDLYRPAETAQLAVLDLVQIDLNAPLTTAPLSSTGVLAQGWVVYASSDHLYVGQTSWWWWWGWGDLDLNTQIHKFQLGSQADYVASGEVEGWLTDQFSMSEYEGFLRVATTDVDWWWGTTEDTELGSRVSVLAETGDTLTKVGEVSGIAPGEWIYASRMMGDKGYLVTYEQVDPLFTLDLSDPTNPRVMGELVLPGYSAYLHPMDEDHLLAVGMAGEEDGTLTGLAINIFDVSDMAAPTLAQQVELSAEAGESWAWSEALWDHHAFTYRDGVLSIPVYTYSWEEVEGEYTYDWFSGLLVLSVDPDAGISEIGRVDHAGLVAESECKYGYASEEGYTCEDYAWVRRGVYIEDGLYSVSDYGLLVNELADPSVEIARVLFYPAE